MKKRPAYNVGGQAVIEGVMMRGPKSYYVAVRNPAGNIVTKEEDVKPMNVVRHIPIVRGVFSFFDSMVLGTKMIGFSTDIALAEEEEEAKKGKFEMFLEERMGRKASDVIIFLSVCVSIIIGVALFMVLPTLLTSTVNKYVDTWALGIVEGLVRLGIFIVYMLLISRMKDIQRVFMYHGAEHKSINCLESGKELTVDNVRAATRFHKRCGTSFLVLIMLISMLFFMFVRTDDVLLRVATRILTVPFLAGISYEVLRWAGRSDSLLVDIISYPGVLMQHITTKEPDDSQIEVAIVSLKGVLKRTEEWNAGV